MRYIRAKRDAAKSLTADGLLLDINGFSIAVVAAHVDSARASRWADSIASDVAVSC